MDARRPSYEVKTHQLLTLAALLVGKNAIFKLPYLLFAYGAVPFFFAYTTFTVSVVIPIMHLENTLGQFSGSGNLGIFDASPVLRGMGYTMTFYFTLGMVVFCTECSYSTVFLVNWFHNPFPWADCDQDWMTDKESCYVQTSDMILCKTEREHIVSQYENSGALEGIPVSDGIVTVFVPEPEYANMTQLDCVGGSVSATESFFEARVLRISTETGDASSVHPEMAVTTAVLWLITYWLTRNGVHKNKYIIYAIVAFSTLSLILLVGVSLTLEGSTFGLLLLLRSRTSSFYDYKLWRDALKMCVGHIGILGSAFLNVVRFNTFKNNLKFDIIALTVMQLTTMLLHSVLFFAYAGYLSVIKHIDTDKLFQQTTDIQYVMIPEALTVLDPTGFFCILYFSWFTFHAISYMFVGPEVLLEVIFFEFPTMVPFRQEFAFFSCVFFYVLGFAACTQEGTYLKKLLIYDLEILAAIVLLLETTVFLHVYGLPRVMIDYHAMTGSYPNYLIRISWAAILPFTLTVLLLLELIQQVLPSYNDSEYNHWHRLLGVWLIFFGVSFIPAYICAMLTTYGWEQASAPLSTWVPDNRAIKLDYRKLLREFGFEMNPDVASGIPSIVANVSGGTPSRGDTITIAETIDPREGATPMERSVTFAPDVITSPRWANENFNELLEHQFGLTNTSRSSFHDHTGIDAEVLLEVAGLLPAEEEILSLMENKEKPLMSSSLVATPPTGPFQHDMAKDATETPPGLLADVPVEVSSATLQVQRETVPASATLPSFASEVIPTDRHETLDSKQQSALPSKLKKKKKHRAAKDEGSSSQKPKKQRLGNMPKGKARTKASSKH